jgi:hypothetical protein
VELQAVLNPVLFVKLLLLVGLATITLFSFRYSQHFVFAFRDPIIKKKVCNLGIFLLMLKTTHDNAIHKMYPVWDAFDKLIFLPKQLVFF